MVKAIFITLLSIFLISACAQPGRLDRDYGRSVKQFQSNQVLDPEAGKNLEPVTGLDGEAARVSIEKYRESFKTPQEAPQPLVQTGTQTNKGKE
jgi:hypothetical protein